MAQPNARMPSPQSQQVRARRFCQTLTEPILLTDSFGAVLLLTLLDYLAVSTLLPFTWGRAVVNFLLGLTLFVSMRTAHARPLWRLLAALLTVIGLALVIGSAVSIVPIPEQVGQLTTIVGWLLLLVAPIAILRRISQHIVVTTETVLGAVSVYLLAGFSFSAIYAALDYTSSTPFFVNVSHANVNDYLFFSYTTLTTVGYGNLVPAEYIGQTVAVIEALLGQIYLVLVVARLVSLWGTPRQRPQTEAELSENLSAGDTDRDTNSLRPSE